MLKPIFQSPLLYRIIVVMPVLLATACSHTTSSFVAAPEDADGGSVVYIYRPSSPSNFMFSPRLIIDDQERFKIGNGDYRYVYLQAGEHTLGLNATNQYSSGQAITLEVEPGQSHYIRINTSLTFEAEKMNTRKFWIEVVDESAALSEIDHTEYAGSAQQPPAVEQRQDGPGFSVDKTQDPFAGKYQ